VYNYTTAPSSFTQNFTVPLLVYPELYQIKTSVDNGIIIYQNHKKGLNRPPALIDATYSTFPNPPDRMLNSISLVPTIGLFYFALTPLITFVIILTEVVKEKEFRLRQGLVVVGLSHSSFWLSWGITGGVISAITTLSLIFAGYAC